VATFFTESEGGVLTAFFTQGAGGGVAAFFSKGEGSVVTAFFAQSPGATTFLSQSEGRRTAAFFSESSGGAAAAFFSESSGGAAGFVEGAGGRTGRNADEGLGQAGQAKHTSDCGKEPKNCASANRILGGDTGRGAGFRTNYAGEWMLHYVNS
jgi:hypothetical protein